MGTTCPMISAPWDIWLRLMLLFQVAQIALDPAQNRLNGCGWFEIVWSWAVHCFLLFSTFGGMPRRTIWISNTGPGLSCDWFGRPFLMLCKLDTTAPALLYLLRPAVVRVLRPRHTVHPEHKNPLSSC